MKKPVALIIMDGFGESKNTDGNAIASSNTPNLDKIMNEYPHTLIQASGLDVGLPDGQMGNSEVGHTNIGAGRIVYQDLTRVSKAIEDGDELEIDFNSGIIKNITKNESYKGEPFPKFMQNIINSNGLINYIKN